MNLLIYLLIKSSVPGDKSAMIPGGIIIGTPALTSRGFNENDFIKVAEFLDRIIKIALNIQSNTGTKLSPFL